MATQVGFGTFEDLKAWQLAAEVAEEIYRLTEHFPQDERFGLTSQVRRSAVSIAANLAEGWGRGAGADFARFVVIARGSASETRSHLLLAKRVGLVNDIAQPLASLEKLSRMLTNLAKAVR